MDVIGACAADEARDVVDHRHLRDRRAPAPDTLAMTCAPVPGRIPQLTPAGEQVCWSDAAMSAA
jgi:hypothetical protein